MLTTFFRAQPRLGIYKVVILRVFISCFSQNDITSLKKNSLSPISSFFESKFLLWKPHILHSVYLDSYIHK